jgi:hypothetical protein
MYNQETPVSESHLWGGIKENMEKEISRREAIVIQHLSAPTASGKVHDSGDTKVLPLFLSPLSPL